MMTTCAQKRKSAYHHGRMMSGRNACSSDTAPKLIVKILPELIYLRQSDKRIYVVHDVAELNSLVRYARMRRIHKPNAKRSTDATLYMEIN